MAISKPDPMFTPREAARLLGVSYPTIKQWILSGKLKTIQTPGGHHRISQSVLKPFVQADKNKPAADSRERFRRVSGRNQLAGRIVSIRVEGLLAEVVIAIGDNSVTGRRTTSASKPAQRLIFCQQSLRPLTRRKAPLRKSVCFVPVAYC